MNKKMMSLSLKVAVILLSVGSVCAMTEEGNILIYNYHNSLAYLVNYVAYPSPDNSASDKEEAIGCIAVACQRHKDIFGLNLIAQHYWENIALPVIQAAPIDDRSELGARLLNYLSELKREVQEAMGPTAA